MYTASIYQKTKDPLKVVLAKAKYIVYIETTAVIIAVKYIQCRGLGAQDNMESLGSEMRIFTLIHFRCQGQYFIPPTNYTSCN